VRIIFSIIYAPLVYFVLRYFDIGIDDMPILKSIPILLSTIFTITLLLSYIKKESIILILASRFKKEKIPKEEREYIHTSTKYWLLVSMANISLHVILFYTSNDSLWLIYSSIGWIGLFLFAGIFQYIHREFIFLKRLNSEPKNNK
jgi:uncharacterized membrane protein